MTREHGVGMKQKLINVFIAFFVVPFSVIAFFEYPSSASAGPDYSKNAVKNFSALLSLPLGLDEEDFYVPEDNPLTAAKIELGRLLFFDRRLSADDSVACSSCHSPDKGFGDNRRVSLGINAQLGGRNAPTIINRFSNVAQFWDGRAKSLEEQAKGPLTNPLEMGMPDLDAVVTKVAAIKGYRERFEKVFDQPVNIDDLARAIASFERTIVSGNSKWDRYIVGDKFALSLSEKRGLEVFEAKGRCNQCHSGWNFTDEKYHNIGIDWDAPQVDLGRFFVTGKEKDIGAFKTPTLRDISRTAPFMHDGRFSQLSEVVDYYNDGGILNPFLSTEMLRPDLSFEQTLERFSEKKNEVGKSEGGELKTVPIKKLHLSEQEKEDLVAFLIALGGEGWQGLRPPSSFPK